MTMQFAIQAKALDHGYWKTSLDPDEVRQLGSPVSELGTVSVLGVSNPEWRSGTIFFNPRDVVVLNQGTTEIAVLIQLDQAGPIQQIAAERIAAKSRSISSQPEGNGDAAFLAECRKLLRPDIAQIADDLIKEIRRLAPEGSMKEGKGRKWVNYPGNFVALTIQNRDQSLAVSVKGWPADHANTPLELKPELKSDRPGYSRFKINSSSKLGAAKFVILRSFNLLNHLG